MLWKCCTQYVSKFGKLSSDHRTGKVSFISIPKDSANFFFQTTRQLCSFCMLVRLCSKSFKLSFSSMWTENFQMYKLGLEKLELQEIKLSMLIRSQRKQGDARKAYISASLTIQILTLWITIKCGKFLEMGIPDHDTCLLRNLCTGQVATVRTGHGTMEWFKIGKGTCQGCILSLILLI